MEGWTIEKFSNVVVYTKKPKGLKVSFPIPFVAMDLIPLDKMEINSFKLIDKVKSGNYVEDGDILLAKITPSFENGKQGILTIGKKYAYATTEVIPFKGKDNFADTLYLAYYLKKDDVRIELAEKMEGSTGRQRLSKSVLDNLPIPLPPLPEQRKISHVLSTVQKAIEQQDMLIHTTTELKKALMQKLFTEGTRGEPQKETEIGLVPESWEVVEFPKFVLLQRGKDLTKKNFMDGDIPVAGSSGVMGYHNQSFVKAPGVTVGRSGSCGIVNYYDKDFWAHNTSLYVKDFNGNDEMFCFYYLQFLDIGKFKTGASVPTLDRNSLNTFEVPVPKKEEQKDIAKYIKTIESKIESSKNKKQTLTALFKTLLHELMTGQRRVHELEFDEINIKVN